MDASTVSSHSKAGTRRILWVRGLRAFGDGYVSLLLPAYLLQRGLSPLDVGILATSTLVGSAASTLLVGLHAHRFGSRTLLVGATLLMTATGLGLATAGSFWPLLVVAIIGTLNPSSGDVSVFLPLEQAALARFAGDRQRTALFARYSLVGALAGAAGALCAAAPELYVAATGAPLAIASQAMFVLYAVLGCIAAVIYRALPRGSVVADGSSGHRAAALGPSRRIVLTLAALFSLDAFAGGFIVQSMLALWLLGRFGLSVAAVGAIFFWTGILSALSYVVAVRIARKLGLVNTMVFTHLPSSVLLLLVPLMPTLALAVALLLARSALSQMDVPTRNSYVMAVVTPSERAAAASITSVSRGLASSASPLIAGWLLGFSAFGWPLIVAGALKIVYDLALLATFRKLRPPEESAPATTPGEPPS
ncbi:MAG TPA: MFS transporter [Casimicrobiaceae bacterium]|nr:MFS transporter [Casimicrobiaceae bacterium]